MIHRMYEFLKRAANLPDGTTPTNELTAKILPLGQFNSSNPPYPTVGWLKAWGKTKPTDASTGYAPGCEFTKVDGSNDTVKYFNTGTVTSCTFKTIPEIAGLMGMTVASGKTLAVTTADKLTVGDIIVPQELEIPIPLTTHASVSTRALFYATKGWTVTGITYEPSVAEGTGSVVCTVCKVTGNNVAVAATTPMCTAFAVTGTAGTPVTATLTGTAADLALVATNKIGCIFSGGDSLLDTGSGILTIKMKRS